MLRECPNNLLGFCCFGAFSSRAGAPSLRLQGPCYANCTVMTDPTDGTTYLPTRPLFENELEDGREPLDFRCAGTDHLCLW